MKLSDCKRFSAYQYRAVMIYRIAWGVVLASLVVGLLGMTYNLLWVGVEAVDARNRWLWAEYPAWTACGIIAVCSVNVGIVAVAIWIWERP